MNHFVATKLIVSGAVCSRCCMCMNASSNFFRDALRSDGSVALSASSVGVNSLDNAWRLMSAMRAFTKACCTAPLFDPDVHGMDWLPFGGWGAVIISKAEFGEWGSDVDRDPNHGAGAVNPKDPHGETVPRGRPTPPP